MTSPLKLIRLGLAGELLGKIFGVRSRPPQLPEFGEEIFVPGQNGPQHNGFVNCENNAVGLKARFYRAGSMTGMRWRNQAPGYEGYPGITHGGVTASLLDELMTNTVFHERKKFGVTVKAEFKWHKTLKAGDPITGIGEFVYSTTEFARVKGYLFRGDGKMVASCDGTFYFPTLPQFKRLAELSSVPEDFQVYFRQADPKKPRA